LLLAEWALAAGMPLLGVCRGIQVMNVVCGGTLYQDLHSERPDLLKHDYFPPKFERFRIVHRIDIEPDSLLARALGGVHEVNSMHHQGLADLGEGLRVVARAEDGLVEAVELPPLPFAVGVQWHPEELAKTDQHSSSLFEEFVRAAASDWRSQPPVGWTAPLGVKRKTVNGAPINLAGDALAHSSVQAEGAAVPAGEGCCS
jgi:putative glutamine amidotransferase